MPEPAYMRIRHRKEFIPGPITECGEDNLWEIQEFAHEISGKPAQDPWSLSQWDARHKVLQVVLEVGSFLPRLYGVKVDQGEYINRVEIFWRQYSEKYKKNHFYFKHTIYPVKITSIKMLMPNVKDKQFERYKHLVAIEFRYRFIEHLYFEGFLHTKAEWHHFFYDESDEPIPEKYLTGRCLSHEALEWEEQWRKSQQVISLTNPRWTHTSEERREESPKQVAEGDTIQLTVDVSGADAGEKVSFMVLNKGTENKQKLAFIEGTQRNGSSSVEWTVDKSNINDKDNIELAFNASCVGISTVDVDIPMEMEGWGIIESLDGELVPFFVFSVYDEDKNKLISEATGNNGLIPSPFERTEEHTVYFRQLDMEE